MFVGCLIFSEDAVAAKSRETRQEILSALRRFRFQAQYNLLLVPQVEQTKVETKRAMTKRHGGS